MVCLLTLLEITEKLNERNNLKDFEIRTIENINNYFHENDYSIKEIKYCSDISFKKIKLDKIFNENQLNDLFLTLNHDDYLRNFVKIFNILYFECFKIPTKDLINLFKDCFIDKDYLFSYNFDFHYNCIHIDKIISFEKLIEISNFFKKFHILISFEFTESCYENYDEIIITFENCNFSENICDDDFINFYFQLLPNKYMRCY